MKKLVLFTCLSALATVSAFSQGGRFWTPNNENVAAIVKDKAVSRVNYPSEFKLFNLDVPAFTQTLLSITGNNRVRTSTIISLPNADGGIEEFEVVEASNFDPELQAQFPEIRAFSGKGITDKYATLKLSISPEGVQTMVFRTEKENEFIEPYSKDRRVYSVYKSNREKGRLPWTCSTEDRQTFSGINSQISSSELASAAGTSSGQLKTLRLAQSCNGEYSNYFGAFSSADVSKVLAAFNNTLTRCNGVFERDLALHLNLIPSTTAVIFYDPKTDPYTTMSSWNNQLQSTLTSKIGEANYDIGHMFGASGGGGNAGCIGCVCVDGQKGRGITSPADAIPQGDNFDIDYVAHEIGHQLGANHTFSHSLEGKGQSKEVGSGITIMGYAGITSYDVAPHSIDIFHATSIAQITANLAPKTCPVTTSANNAAPVIAAVNNYTIPISTPFALTAQASDVNGDALTYCWEQNDNATTSGSGSNATPTKTTGPNWISFRSVASPIRLFPQLPTILAGQLITPRLPGGDAGMNMEALSSVSRTLNFRLTVRDNHPYSSSTTSVGQTAFTDVVVTVTSNAGPFQVTAPNSNVTWNAGSTATVTWSVNGTNAGSVNCTAVNILLSTDGGNTFPVVLANATPNDGTHTVTVPNTPGSNNRIKVEAAGNIFFDISNTNFTIGSATPTCGDATGLTASNITQTSATVSWTAVSSATGYTVDYKAASSGTWISAGAATTATSLNLTGLTAGTLYDWRVRATCSSVSGNYVQAQFTTTSATPTCGDATGLTASNITQTSATVSWNAVNGATGYTVDYKAASSGTWISTGAGTTATSFNISGLTAGTVYDWRVRATCSSISGNYVQAQFTTTSATPTCGDATGLTTTNITQTSATVSWTAVSGATSYTVEFKVASASTWTTATASTTATSLNLTGLTASTVYDWRVKANCSSASGNYVQSQFTTAGSTPTPTCPGTLDVSTNGTANGAAEIQLNTDVYGTIEVKGDNDYYKIILDAGNITVSLTTLPADYQLSLLSSNGSTVLQSSTNNGTTPETINRTVTAGTYYVRVYPRNNGAVNATNCYTLRVETSTPSKIGVDAVTSSSKDVEKINAANQLRVQPNPSSSNTSLYFTAPESGRATISVMSQTGAVVSAKTVSVIAGENLKNLDVSTLANGVYIIRVQTGSVIQMTKLVVAK